MQQPDFAAASVRNAAPILGALRDEVEGAARVLEIGSGTGFHAVYFASELPAVQWQCSDLVENHGIINAAMESAALANVLPPLEFDVRDAEPPRARYDIVYTSNTAHIMDAAAVEQMFRLVPKMLDAGGKFLCYGPFKRGGEFNTPSNEAFDASLRGRGVGMGLRDLDECDRIAAEGQLFRRRTYAMPSNNLFTVWHKGDRLT